MENANNFENLDDKNSSFFEQKVSSSNSKEDYIPKLRFKGFNKLWNTKNMGEMGTFTKGAPLSKADISNTGSPFILYGELYTTYKEVTYQTYRQTNAIAPKECLSSIGDVIIPTSGETPEEIATATCVMLPNVILGGDLNIYRNNVVDGRIVSYIINHKINKNIAKVAQGKSVVHIKADDLSKMNIIYPDKNEQVKIIDFLSLVDERIEKQRQLVENLKIYKRGLLAAIFDGKFNLEQAENWNNILLSDILKERKTYCEKDGTFEHATLSKEGVSAKTERYERDFLVSDENKKYKITKLGDICYNPANLKFGVICLNTYGEAIFSPIYVTFEINNKYNKEFIGYCLTRRDFISRALKYQQGTVYERMAVSPEDLLSMRINIPNRELQDKIAKLLIKMDKKLIYEDNKLNLIIKMKKSLLQQMFI